MAADGQIDVQSLGRGVHELLVLAALKGRPLHGYALAQAITERSRGRVILQHGTLYPILHRLERLRDIESRWVETEERRRRVYALTHAGASRLRDETAALKRNFDDLMEMVRVRTVG